MSDVLSGIDGEIAARVRRLRLAQGLTLDRLAQQAGISRAMLSRVERGESSPTAQLLVKLCNGLGITLAGLFAGTAGAPAEPVARRDAQPTWRDPASGYLRRAVSPPGTGSAVDLAEIEFPPGARASFDNGARADQQIWVLKGTLELSFGGRTVRLGVGDCLWMRLDGPASFHNPTAQPVRYAVVVHHHGIAGRPLDHETLREGTLA